MKKFNVIRQNINQETFEPYNVIPYFVREYNKLEVKPKTYNEFYKFIKNISMYMFWSRCEYEIIIAGWPNIDTAEKWDIHRQIMMNIDIIIEILMDYGKNN